MAQILIYHAGLGAQATVAEESLPEWAEVGWTRVEEAPTDAEWAAQPAKHSKKQPTTQKEHSHG